MEDSILCTSPLEVWDSVLCEVGSWLIVFMEFIDVLLNDIMRDWSACLCMYSHRELMQTKEWYPPSIGNLKLNFDGSFMGNPGTAGYGCIV